MELLLGTLRVYFFLSHRSDSHVRGNEYTPEVSNKFLLPCSIDPIIEKVLIVLILEDQGFKQIIN